MALFEIIADANYYWAESNEGDNSYSNSWNWVEHGIEEPPDTNQGIVYSLSQNFPNPFSEKTIINYSIASKGDVRLWIYDVSGRIVRRFVEKNKAPGRYKVMWNGKNKIGEEVPAGIYYVKLHSGDFRVTKKMILIQ